MTDLFTKKELEQFAREVCAQARLVLLDGARSETMEQSDKRNLQAQEISNNAVHAVMASMSELLPYVDEDVAKSARSCIWANETEGVGRAGLMHSVAHSLERLMVSGKQDNADAALCLLEMRLFALFVACRKLRKLPAECRDEHVVTSP